MPTPSFLLALPMEDDEEREIGEKLVENERDNLRFYSEDAHPGLEKHTHTINLFSSGVVELFIFSKLFRRPKKLPSFRDFLAP